MEERLTAGGWQLKSRANSDPLISPLCGCIKIERIAINVIILNNSRAVSPGRRTRWCRKHKSTLMRGARAFPAGASNFAQPPLFWDSRPFWLAILPWTRRCRVTISFLPTAIILQFVRQDVPSFAKRAFSPSFTSILLHVHTQVHKYSVCIWKTTWYTVVKTGWSSYRRGAVRAHIRHFIGIWDFLRDAARRYICGSLDAHRQISYTGSVGNRRASSGRWTDNSVNGRRGELKTAVVERKRNYDPGFFRRRRIYPRRVDSASRLADYLFSALGESMRFTRPCRLLIVPADGEESFKGAGRRTQKLIGHSRMWGE